MGLFDFGRIIWYILPMRLKQIAPIFLYIFLTVTRNGYCQIDHRIEFGFSALTIDGKLPRFKEISKFESRTGINVETMNWYLGFNGDNKELPNIPLKCMAEYKDQDITLMLTLEPWGETMDWRGQRKDPLRAINDGYLDRYLRRMASQLRKFGRPIRLRFGHEMIQDDHPDTRGWYSWQDRAKAYKKAFIRVHDIFVDENAMNVEFVWSPNSRPALLKILAKYYPGPEYVDWIGIDGYNWNGESFDELFQLPYKNIVEHPEIFGNKPIMIAEFAAGDDKKLTVFDKAAWIKDAFEKIPTHYPMVGAIYWFNVKKERDWRLDSSDASWEAFQEGIRNWRD